MHQCEQRKMGLGEYLRGGPAVANDGGEQVKIGGMGNFFSEQHFHLL